MVLEGSQEGGYHVNSETVAFKMSTDVLDPKRQAPGSQNYEKGGEGLRGSCEMDQVQTRRFLSMLPTIEYFEASRGVSHVLQSISGGSQSLDDGFVSLRLRGGGMRKQGAFGHGTAT